MQEGSVCHVLQSVEYVTGVPDWMGVASMELLLSTEHFVCDL